MAQLEGSSSVLYGDEIFIFGGRDNKTGQLMNCLWKISVSGATAAAAANSAKEVELANATSSPTTTSRMGYASDLSASGNGAAAQIVNTTGTPPTPRCYHSTALRPPFMLIWGGTSLHPAQVTGPRGDKISEATCRECVIFAFHLETREWGVHVLQSKETKCPKTRCHATMSTTSHSILLYGGYPNSHDEEGENAHVESNHWSVFEVGADAQVRSNARSGSEVPMLWGHSAAFAHGCLVVFGGVDFATMTETNALCLFSLEEKRWRWAEFALAPEARALHSSVLHGSNMFVYGGFTGRPDRTENPTFGDVWRFSLNTGLWDECACSGSYPQPRSGHTSVVSQNNMIVIGGLEGNKELLPDHASLAVLDLLTYQWTHCPVLFPLPTAGNSAIEDNSSPYGNNSGNNNNSDSVFGSGGGGKKRAAGSLSASDLLAISAASASGGKKGNQNNNISGDGGEGGKTPRQNPNALRTTSLTPQGEGGGGTNNQQQQNRSGDNSRGESVNNNNNASAASGPSLMKGMFGGAGNFRRPSQNSSTPTSQAQRELMEAAAPVSFGGLTSGQPAPQFAASKRVPQSPGQIPAATPNANNNNASLSRSSTPGGGFLPLSSSSQQAQYQPHQNQQQQQQQRSGTPTSSSYSFSFGGVSNPNQHQNQYQNQQQGFSPSSILSGGYSVDDIMTAPPSANSSPPGAGGAGGMNSFSSLPQYNNNQQNYNQQQQQQKDMRSPSHALLSNINNASQREQDRQEREKQQMQQQMQAYQNEHQQQLQQQIHQINNPSPPQHQQQHQPQYQNMSPSQRLESLQNNNNGSTPHNNTNNNGGGGGGGSAEMGWASSFTPPQASAGALEASKRRKLNRTPPRPEGADGGSPDQQQPSTTQTNVGTAWGSASGFSSAASTVQDKAAAFAAQQAAQEAMKGPPPENLPVFGVRPQGTVGRSNSVGLGMPPSMIDVMGHTSVSPSRIASSSAAAGAGRSSVSPNPSNYYGGGGGGGGGGRTSPYRSSSGASGYR